MTKLNPADATVQINACAKKDEFGLHWTVHAKEQLLERGLISADLLYLLKFGFVYDEAEKSTRESFYKYNIESRTPNSGGRVLRSTVIPDGKCHIKIITIMWKDEAR